MKSKLTKKIQKSKLTAKLGIWGKDKIVREDGKCYAEDYYCVKCYKGKIETRAKSFWPAIDPDIPSYPYCGDCKMKLNLYVWEEMEKKK